MSGKISIIGAGMTGATTAQWLAERGIADLVLIDIVEGRPQGKALDLLEAMPIVGRDISIVGSNDYAAIRGSDIVMITAGVPRRPGLSREDLLLTNARIVREATEKAVQEAPQAIFIVLTNPLDAMAYLTMKAGHLPPERVVGQAGVLDAARMRTFVALESGVSVESVACYVLGGHDEAMVPLVRHSNVAGVPLCEFLPPDRLQAIIERTRRGGDEILELLREGASHYAPGAALAQMAEAILEDRHLILPASAYLQGEYGLKDIFLGVSVQLGRRGVERILEYRLNAEEQAALQKSAAEVQEQIAMLKAVMKDL